MLNKVDKENAVRIDETKDEKCDQKDEHQIEPRCFTVFFYRGRIHSLRRPLTKKGSSDWGLRVV